MADEAQLEAVFELCGPRKKDRKISLRKLESLFEEHTNSKVRFHTSYGKNVPLTKRYSSNSLRQSGRIAIVSINTSLRRRLQ